MADTITAERRSWNMSRIRGVDTRPERQLRSLLHSAGYWFNDEGALDLFVADFDCRNELGSLAPSEVSAGFGRVEKFFDACISKSFYQKLEVTSPEYGLARQIADRKSFIRQVNLHLLSERMLSDRIQSLEDGVVAGVPVTYNIWDISRLQRQRSAKGHKEPLDIDFPEMFGAGIPCLPAHLGSQSYQSYLIVIPADVLAGLYGKYGARLLEQNVRSFLQARGKVNQGIRTTILSEPQMFFAYNNGITATAQEVEIAAGDGGLQINRLQDGYFNVIADTSAATALAARMGAQILADRAALWPETVRGLIVHSADWTPAMRGHLPVNPRQNHKRLLLRRYGYGVPDLARAIRSQPNDVTLVIENAIQPFVLDGSTIKTRGMIFHDLPWPAGTLEALGEEQVQLRVTLSYFVEPNPGERGWTKRHRYASHGLRFAVKRPEEDVDTFRGRINAAAREEEDGDYAGGQDDGWVLGPRLRDRGSLHSDIWEGTAADLANRHGIAVYPTGGWWREKKGLERYDREVRYALILTLRAQTAIDLYTEIANAIGVEVNVEIN